MMQIWKSPNSSKSNFVREVFLHLKPMATHIPNKPHPICEPLPPHRLLALVKALAQTDQCLIHLLLIIEV